MTEKEYIIKNIKAAQHGNMLVQWDDIADTLLKNGITVLPCKVGAIVYYYCDDFKRIADYQVAYIHISDAGISFEAYYSGCCELLDAIDFDLDDIGKTVFLSKDNAEKALEEIRCIEYYQNHTKEKEVNLDDVKEYLLSDFCYEKCHDACYGDVFHCPNIQEKIIKELYNG